jgi:hypothetical protein
MAGRRWTTMPTWALRQGLRGRDVRPSTSPADPRGPDGGLLYFGDLGRKTLYQNSYNISFIFGKNYSNFD